MANIKKPITLGPTFQPLKDVPRAFDSMQGFDKRLNKFVGDSITQALQAPGIFGESILVGYFNNGGNVSVNSNRQNFVSPLDGHQYSQDEVLYYISSIIATRAPGGGFFQGQKSLPPMSNTNSGAGQVYWFEMFIDDRTLNVTTKVSYFDGAEHITTDGILKVTAFCKRKS